MGKYIIIILSNLYCLCAANAVVYHVGVQYLNYKPYYWIGPHGEFNSPARDILDTFAKKNGDVFIYHPRSVQRLYSEYLQDKIFDFIFPDNPNWNLEEKKKYLSKSENPKIEYSAPMFSYLDGVLVKNEYLDKGIEFFKLIGVPRGFTVIPSLKKMPIQFEESNNIESLLNQLKKDKIQGAYINEAVGLTLLNTSPKTKDKFSINKKIPFDKDNYYFSGRGHADVMTALKSFMESTVSQKSSGNSKNYQ